MMHLPGNARTRIAVALCTLVFAPVLFAKGAEARLAGTGELIRGKGPAVYLYNDGKRYPFPNESIFYSWPGFDFRNVRTVSAASLAATPLGASVIYRPGSLIKLTTDPKVYAVDENGGLRWITTEKIAATLYGGFWNRLVQDVPDALFADYEVGKSVTAASQFLPELAKASAPSFASILMREKVAERSAAAKPSIDSFTHPASVSGSQTDPFGYTATSAQSSGELRDWFVGHAAGWTLSYEYAEPSGGAAETVLLNFIQTRGSRTAHRSVVLFRSPQGAGETAILFAEMEYPAGYLAYPDAATIVYVAEDRDISQASFTDQAADKVITWYRTEGAAHGWSAPASFYDDVGSVPEEEVFYRMEQTREKKVARFLPPSPVSDLAFALLDEQAQLPPWLRDVLAGGSVHAIIGDYGPGLD